MTKARLAGFATRALAFLVDCAILNVATLAVAALITWAGGLIGLTFSPSAPVVAGLAAAGWLCLMSVYLVVFWWLAGQTPGMRFMGIRVTNLRGTRPGLVRSLRRLAGMYLAALPLGAGFLLVLVDDRRRGLQDRVAATLVVHDAAGRRRPTGDLDHLDRMMPAVTENGSIVGPGAPTAKDLDHAASP